MIKSLMQLLKRKPVRRYVYYGFSTGNNPNIVFTQDVEATSRAEADTKAVKLFKSQNIIKIICLDGD